MEKKSGKENSNEINDYSKLMVLFNNFRQKKDHRCCDGQNVLHENCIAKRQLGFSSDKSFFQTGWIYNTEILCSKKMARIGIPVFRFPVPELQFQLCRDFVQCLPWMHFLARQ